MGLFLLPDHFIMIETVRNGAADTVEASVLSLDDGRVRESVDNWSVPDLATGKQENYFFIYDQELVSVLVRPTTASVVPRGTFVTIWLCKGNRSKYIRIAVLNSGYATPEYPMDWPVNIENRNQVCPAPVLFANSIGLAGSEVRFDVTTDVEVEVLSFVGNFTADANVINRYPLLTQLSPGAVTHSVSMSAIPIVALQVLNVSGDRTQLDDQQPTNDIQYHLNSYTLYNSGAAILDVVNRQAADIWNTVDWTYRERILT